MTSIWATNEVPAMYVINITVVVIVLIVAGYFILVYPDLISQILMVNIGSGVDDSDNDFFFGSSAG